MDFKVAGTEQGITAFQMDIKIAGVSSELLREALDKARAGRLKILEIMRQTMDRPRDAVSDFAPKIITMRIDVDKIGAVIGSGGLQHPIDHRDHRGRREHRGRWRGDHLLPAARKAPSAPSGWSSRPVEEPEVGKTYTARVTRIMDFGAFMEILPGQGRSLPHFPADRRPCRPGRGRGQAGRRGAGEAHRDRPHGPPEPCHAGCRGPGCRGLRGRPGIAAGPAIRCATRVGGGGRRPGPGRRERFGPNRRDGRERRDGRDGRPPRSRSTSGGARTASPGPT